MQVTVIRFDKLFERFAEGLRLTHKSKNKINITYKILKYPQYEFNNIKININNLNSYLFLFTIY